MDTTDEKMRAAIGETVAIHDPKFAGVREAVDYHSPALAVASAEGERLRERVERLQSRLTEARESGAGQDVLDALESRLDGAVAAWVEFATVDDGPEVAAVPDCEMPGMGQQNYISLTDLMRRDLDSGAALAEGEMKIRIDAFRAFNRFAFQDGIANIALAFKNWVAVVNRTNPELLDGVSKADLARLFGETRAATSDREIRVVEGFLKAAGVKGFQLLGGNKPESTRRRCARSAKGNQNRRGGKSYLDRRDAEAGAA